MTCGSLSDFSKILVHQPDGTIHSYTLSSFEPEYYIPLEVPEGSYVAGAYAGFTRTGCPSSYTKYRPSVCVDSGCYDSIAEEKTPEQGTQLWMTIQGYRYGNIMSAGTTCDVYICVDGWTGSRWEQVLRGRTCKLKAVQVSTPPSFVVTKVTRSPESGAIAPGEYVTVTATVKNNGGTGNGSIDWYKGSSRVSTSDVYVSAGGVGTATYVHHVNAADAGTTIQICAEVR